MQPEHVFERTRVASISVETDEGSRTYRNCWVAIRHSEQLVDVWLTEKARLPDLSLPLSAISIQWSSLPRRLDAEEL